MINLFETHKSLARLAVVMAISALAVAVALLLGLARARLQSAPDTSATLPWVYFHNLTINGRPAQLILDTGAGFASLGSTSANRLGVKAELPQPGESQFVMKYGAGVWIWSDPISMAFGDQTFTAPFYIRSESSALDGFDSGYGIDGAIGWQEVRDNILVFDPRRHTIRAVEKLPDVTAGWLKLHVRPDQYLLIDLPLPSGKTGTVLVDTGFQIGVGLPREEWTTWRAAHPRDSVFTNHLQGDFLGSGNVETAWPDEFTWGGLTLSHVMVIQAPPAIEEAIPNFAGVLGLNALERMDVIVDGPGGYVYLKLRTASDPVSQDNLNWSVEGTVRLSNASMLDYFHREHGLKIPK